MIPDITVGQIGRWQSVCLPREWLRQESFLRYYQEVINAALPSGFVLEILEFTTWWTHDGFTLRNPGPLMLSMRQAIHSRWVDIIEDNAKVSDFDRETTSAT